MRRTCSRSPSPAVTTDTSQGAQNGRKPPNGSIHKPRQPKPLLAIEPSAALRDQLIAEIQQFKDPDDLALWAHRRLPAKNTLTADDARVVEAAYQEVLNLASEPTTPTPLETPSQVLPDVSGFNATPHKVQHAHPQLLSYRLLRLQPATVQLKLTNSSPTGSRPAKKTSASETKSIYGFVAAQPCLICRRLPCDAHHLRFAQPRSLGRKVSDEFTVPLCREHHQQLHRHGNEAAWWANVQISPITVAEELWKATLSGKTQDSTVGSLRGS